MKPIPAMGMVVVALLAVLVLLPTPETNTRDGSPGSNAAAVQAIVNARLFDGEALIDNATILIEQGRVIAAGAGVELPEGAVLTDAAGKTVVPGLIDAHVHAYGPARTEALRFGVTTLLDMFQAPFDFGVVKSERASLSVTDRADLFSAGFLATAPGGHGTQFGLAVPTLTAPEQAADWVAARKSEGSDWIKIVIESGWGGQNLPTLDAATVRALVEAAHAEGLLAVAHVSRLADARMAVEAGVDGLVHLFGDESLDPALIKTMRERGIFVAPTLAVLASVYGGSGAHDLKEHPVLAPRLGSLQRQTLAQRHAAPGSNASAGPIDLLALPAQWTASADSFMGGNSASRLVETEGASIMVQAELAAGAPFPYAGAMWFAHPTPMQPVDHSVHRRLVVQVDVEEGSAGAMLQLMLFSGGSQQAMPIRIELPAGQPFELALDQVPGLDLPQLRAIGVFVSGSHGFRIRSLVLE